MTLSFSIVQAELGGELVLDRVDDANGRPGRALARQVDDLVVVRDGEVGMEFREEGAGFGERAALESADKVYDISAGLLPWGADTVVAPEVLLFVDVEGGGLLVVER